MLLHRTERAARNLRILRLHNVHIPRAARPVGIQPLLAALERNLAGFQITLRQIRRQHIVLARQSGHRVNMLDNKLAVGHPQLHVFQIVRVKAGFLHRLIQRVKQRVMRLINAHALVGQRRGLMIVAEDQPDRFLIGFQRIVGIFAQQPALPL